MKILYGKRKTALAILKIIKEDKVYFNYLDIVKVPELNNYIKLTKLKGLRVITKGGGANAQIEAARLVIAKYAITKNPELKSVIVSIHEKILTSDKRQKEPKKAQCHGARATRQKSYR
jgi:ribosomal protein S9